MQDVTQRSTEWRRMRCGQVTASNFQKVMTPAKAKGEEWGRTAIGYLHEVLAELMTGEPQDRFSSAATQWGDEYEDIHREAAQAIITETFAETITLAIGENAYIQHPTESHIGCSLDGLIGADITLELKCPWNPKNHVERLRENRDVFYKSAKAQIQGGLWITGRKKAVLSSYYPGMPLHTFAYARDEAYIADLSRRVTAFRDLLLTEYRKLSGGPF